MTSTLAMTESLNVPFKILNMPINLPKKKKEKRNDNMKLESIDNKFKKKTII